MVKVMTTMIAVAAIYLQMPMCQVLCRHDILPCDTGVRIPNFDEDEEAQGNGVM